MKALLLCGPHDGEILDVADGTHQVVLVDPGAMEAARAWREAGNPDPSPTAVRGLRYDTYHRRPFSWGTVRWVWVCEGAEPWEVNGAVTRAAYKALADRLA